MRFDMVEEMRNQTRKRLATARVGIAGAGGLGSNCAVALARAGVGSLVVADFDVVQSSNLDRQYYFLDQVGRPKVEALRDNIGRIDPNVRVEAATLRLDADKAAATFAGCSVVVEAFDDAAAKAMLIETVLERLPEATIVAASGIAGWGRVEALGVRRMGRLILVGDLESAVSEELPPMAPRVGVAACMEADLVLELLLGGPSPKGA
ncbi:MAG: sulfur carrier protein ThiS adenylyltransferase ThiF [Spirochaetia bacterium]|nr:sulfur carrier protein ThiS adenylyltransferase ThiF [Spirochaetia bacterium]